MRYYFQLGFLFVSFCPVVAAVALPALPQDADTDSAARFDEWVQAVSQFVEPVRFTETDLQSFLENWTEFSGIDTEEMSDEPETAEDWGELLDFNAILEDSAYTQWAESRGLDGGDWLRKSMRILSMIMREQMTAGFARAEQQMPEQLKMIEEQRAQVGEELYQQMKQALEASAAMLKSSARAAAKLPQPTPAEQALLEKYQPQISEIMQEEDEDGDW